MDNIFKKYLEKNKNINRGYRKLEVWQEGVALFRANIIEEEWFVKYDEMHYSLENKLIKFNKSNIRKLQEQSDWHNDYQIREIIAQYNIYDTGDEK